MIFTEKFNRWFDTYEGKSTSRGCALKNKKLKETLYNEYWKKLKCDYIEDDRLTNLMIDLSLKKGVLHTIKLLQFILGMKQTGIADIKTIITANIQQRVYQKLIVKVSDDK